MEKRRVRRPVLIRFLNYQEAIDLYVAIEFKSFVERLLHINSTHSV